MQASSRAAWCLGFKSLTAHGVVECPCLMCCSMMWTLVVSLNRCCMRDQNWGVFFYGALSKVALSKDASPSSPTLCFLMLSFLKKTWYNFCALSLQRSIDVATSDWKQAIGNFGSLTWFPAILPHLAPVTGTRMNHEGIRKYPKQFRHDQRLTSKESWHSSGNLWETSGGILAQLWVP